MIKKSILVPLVLIFISSLFSAQKNYLYINTKSGLVLRAGPARIFKKIKTLPKNSQVYVLAYSSKKEKIGKISAPWVKVSHYGDEGWIFSGYASEQPEKTFTLTGRFIEASRNDCLSLVFKDSKNKIWDFGDGRNNFDFEEFFKEVDNGQWHVKDKYKNRDLKITAANINGKICEGCEGCLVDGVALTIVRLEVLD